MSDPWERLADRQIVAPRKARMRAAAERARKKALAERDVLFELWKKEQQKRREELMTGVYSADAMQLADFLERMKPSDAPALLALVKKGPWQTADAETKYQVLAMISRAIIYLRESIGLPPFDDSLPGEDPTVYELIRELLQ